MVCNIEARHIRKYDVFVTLKKRRTVNILQGKHIVYIPTSRHDKT